MLCVILVITKHLKLYRDLYYKKMTINDAEMKQNEFSSIVKNTLLNNVKNFYDGRKKTIEGFEKGIFLFTSNDNEYEQQQTSKKPIITDVNAFNEWINQEETDINNEIFTKHFKFQNPSDMAKNLYEINDTEKNNKTVNVIVSGLRDLKEGIKDMSKEERKTEKPDKTVKF